MERIYIFDTTLRDGEQSPGASLNIEEKLEIAKQLARLGVDIIEAGFPITSSDDFKAVRLIAKEIKGGPIICGLARAKKVDIDRCYQAIKYAEKPRIHTFIPSSDVQIGYQLQKSREEVLEIAQDMVSYAKQYVSDVEFSPMDAARADPHFLYQIIEACIEAGATTINIPDTVGYTTPLEFGDLIRNIIENVPNINKAVVSVHCHNDLGLATSNSLSAVLNGARQIECTINGLGERAGNTSLEEVVMALYTRGNYFGLNTGIKLDEIYKTSRLVSTLTGIPVQPNKAIVGENAFSHESGIHQNGILKESTTYEIIRPETIGLKSRRLVLGKHSGRHALHSHLIELGYELDDNQLNKAFRRFKKLADKKKEIFDEDLEAIVEDEIYTIPEAFHLDYLHVSTGTQAIPTATIRIKKEKRIFQEAATGNGPVDAIYKAIDRITGYNIELLDYSLKAVTRDKDALGEVLVKIRHGDKIVSGRGTSTDVIEASANAYLNAINRLVYKGIGK
ncbi:MAG: 2-isopropylmalate synthase [bacterium]|nr:2-isopropylmalate synthase [bacterium]